MATAGPRSDERDVDEASASTSSSKSNQFRRTEDGKFECLLCKRSLASKQNVMLHLHKTHRLTPVKRLKKKYLDDVSIPVPYRTLARWNKFSREQDENAKKSLTPVFQSVETSDHDSSPATNNEAQQPSEVINPLPTAEAPENVLQIPMQGIQETTEGSSTSSHQNQIFLKEEFFNMENFNSSSDLNSDSESSVSTNMSVQYLSSETDTSEISDAESIADSSTMTSEHGDSDSSGSESDLDQYISSDNEDELSYSDPTLNDEVSNKEKQALTILSCFSRNNLSASTCKDILKTMQSVFPNAESVQMLDLKYLLSYVDTTAVTEIHYCTQCFQVFPEDVNIVRCGRRNCDGLRYKGTFSNQQQKGRQPRQCFVMADIKKQMEDLLQTPGIWEDIQENLKSSKDRMHCNIISDITDGTGYKEKMKTDGDECALTAVFNTDGVNLYSSSKIELWPIFLAINELRPALRFSRDNMLLVGIWQGKGKPPFYQYMNAFSEAMNDLNTNGVQIKSGDEVFQVKFSIACGITDLPAKAEMLNMTYFNGTQSCISCLDPGIVVKQGKGTSRCYPYRPSGSCFETRDHESVIRDMQRGSEKHRCNGFKGMSGLTTLKDFDVVKGTVPDYMHGILLGITKTMLNKWFSPSGSQKGFFIGKHLKEISKRLQNIKPLDNIERLPRDLEKHFNNFKATELQAWLLYYAFPCLHGFLEQKYMVNLLCLSEAIYILLGDAITPSSLDRAESLLDQFYATFQDLYHGSCGLNVHNAGRHLVDYVRIWGPLWAWSCFPFEDTNAMLLQAVHGTGLVLKQIMKYRQIQSCIKRKGLANSSKSKSWKIKYDAKNCQVAGALKKFGHTELSDEILAKFGVELNEIQKVDRIVVNDKKFCSSLYGRMKKRICNIVLYEHKKIGAIQCFALIAENVFAVIERMNRVEDPLLSGIDAGKHYIPVKKSGEIDIVNADDLVDTLLYLNTYPDQHVSAVGYVVKMPNQHGHAVFK